MITLSSCKFQHCPCCLPEKKYEEKNLITRAGMDPYRLQRVPSYHPFSYRNYNEFHSEINKQSIPLNYYLEDQLQRGQFQQEKPLYHTRLGKWVFISQKLIVISTIEKLVLC